MNIYLKILINILLAVLFFSNSIAQLNHEWQKLPHNGSGNMVITDHYENILIAGTRTDTITPFSLLKYNSSGILQWASYYNGTGNNSDQCKLIVVDKVDNVFAAGICTQPGSGGNILLIKYSPDGIIQWERRFSGAGNSNDQLTGLLTDKDQNIYLAGNAFDSVSGLFTSVLLKFSQAGEIIWKNYYFNWGCLKSIAIVFSK